MSASFPMYLRPETAGAWQRLWELVRAQIGVGPAVLEQPDEMYAHWRDPALLLSQTCSLPLRAHLAEHVHVVGAFDFALPGTSAGDYHSVILTRPGAGLEAARIAINAADSQSGWAALWDWAGGDITGPIQISGAHIDSARAVASGTADLCAVDAVTWAMIGRYEPALAGGLQVVARTGATPGLPLITGRADLVAPLRVALALAVKALRPEDRWASGIEAFVARDVAPYLALPVPPPPFVPDR